MDKRYDFEDQEVMVLLSDGRTQVNFKAIKDATDRVDCVVSGVMFDIVYALYSVARMPLRYEHLPKHRLVNTLVDTLVFIRYDAEKDSPDEPGTARVASDEDVARFAGLPKTVINSPNEDGPKDGNRFVYQGTTHEDVAPRVWRIINAMWGHDSREVDDVTEEVWDAKLGPEDGGRVAFNAVKAFLSKIGYPRFISKPRNSKHLVWKKFP